MNDLDPRTMGTLFRDAAKNLEYCIERQSVCLHSSHLHSEFLRAALDDAADALLAEEDSGNTDPALLRLVLADARREITRLREELRARQGSSRRDS